jgi:hypothetical protein
VNSEGRVVGALSQIQDRGQPLPKAEAGDKVAVAIKDGFVGRNIHGDEVLYVGLSERDARQLSTNYASMLDEKSLKTLEEFIQIMRRKKPAVGPVKPSPSRKQNRQQDTTSSMDGLCSKISTKQLFDICPCTDISAGGRFYNPRLFRKRYGFSVSRVVCSNA